MNKLQLLSKPAWKHFLGIEGIHDLPLPALLAADQLWEHIRASGTTTPAPSDYAFWAQTSADSDPVSWLEQLHVAITTLVPSEVLKVVEAKRLLVTVTAPPHPSRSTHSEDVEGWDPCEYDGKARVRKVSIYPWDLPLDWQKALRRAAHGLPGPHAAAPARDILKRMREKLCQCAWSAQEAGLAVELSQEIVGRYLTDLEARLRLRAHGIRWATMRATVEELHRFARYSGFVSEEDTSYLGKRMSRYALYEQGQDALKFSALLETGNTTLGLMEKADALLIQAAAETKARQRHLLRNAGAILGLYSIVPLRNADAALIFGDTLFWEAGTWVIDTEIQKTSQHNPERLVVPLEAEFAKYIDAVVQGDYADRHLPDLRARALKSGGALFVRDKGKYTSPTYIPRLFKTYAGTSFTTTRTMLHTDQATSRGEVGTRDAMAAAHQTSPETAKKYQAKSVRQVSVRRVQDAAADRRAQLLPPDLIKQIRALKPEEDTPYEDF
ncbi:hypothetical protein HGG71_02260 [Rhodobacteraceae bacterium R_SAG2]|nr:hypothetical protein [Rhodobacteraceae bacterium R_SAG2]